MEYNPDAILLMRQLEGKTQTELARTLSTTQAMLSKVQNRQTELTADLVRRIAIAEDYPKSFFEDEVVIRPVIELTYRHTSKSSLGELNGISAEYSLLDHCTQTLAKDIGLEPRTEWIDGLAPRRGPLNDDDIERLASKTREFLGIPASGYVRNITRALEKSGIVVAPLHRLAKHDDGKLHSDGVTFPSRSSDEVQLIAYSSNSAAGDRERFTKAHELGHLILHRHRKVGNYRQMEAEAHRFAGAFLLPKADAQAAIDANSMLSDFLTMKSGWGMSIAALISRSRNAGIISYERYRSLFMQLSVCKWRFNEPVHVGIEKPLLFRQMLVRRYGDAHGQVDSFEAERNSKVPFRYLDMWSGGLIEQGSSLGFNAQRFGNT